MLDWLAEVAATRGTSFQFDVVHPEGEWVGAGEPIAFIAGSFQALADCETIFLQKLGPACVAAHNAYQMCAALPRAQFLAMEARHCAGAEMQEIMGYAASVGSAAAQREGALGFVGTSTDMASGFFGATRGRGTMPHALIGYAGSTLRAAQMFHETPSGREPDGADRLFRAGGHGWAGGLPRVSGLGGGREDGAAAGHAWRALPRGAGPGGELCGARAAGRRARSGAIAATPSCATWSAPASRRRRSGGCARRSTRRGSARCGWWFRPGSALRSAG